jgi:hypothetical protein
MSSSTHNGFFDEAAVAAMIVAYDQACRSLQPSGMTPIVREMIGKRIIEADKQGERDPEIPHQQALNAFGIEEARITVRTIRNSERRAGRVFASVALFLLLLIVAGHAIA